MPKIGQHVLEVGQKVAMLENGKVIDRGILRRVGTGGSPEKPEIEVESQKLAPGTKTEFAFFHDRDESKSGWRMLFEDPMAGGRCFSQRAPLYVFKPV